jgi:hypothetical protein
MAELQVARAGDDQEGEHRDRARERRPLFLNRPSRNDCWRAAQGGEPRKVAFASPHRQRPGGHVPQDLPINPSKTGLSVVVAGGVGACLR